MRDNKNTGFLRLLATSFAMAMNFVLITALFPAYDIYAQEVRAGVEDAVSPPVITEVFGTDKQQADDLCSVNAIRRYIARNIRYPADAAEAGHYGTIELYARINNEGRVNEVLELQPVRDYVDVDEIVIVGYAPDGIETTESTRHSELIAESRRVVMSLPRCDIQEIFGQTLKFTLKFVLQ